MIFHPPACPHTDCPSRTRSRFDYSRSGAFERRCDGRRVQRFVCRVCRRGFSEQTFRVDYRLKRPELLERFFFDRVSKVTHRQSARIQGCSRSTEERHFRRLGGHCAAFHEDRLRSIAGLGRAGSIFVLDELETYEDHRTQKPVTVPVLIERRSGFVLDAKAGALAPRRRRRVQGDPAHDRAPPRRSESHRLVRAMFERLRELVPRDSTLQVRTDKKSSYARILRELFGARCLHRRTPARRRRDVRNPLWPINHTFARLRDSVSRLVRETWAAAKKRQWLEAHLSIWVCYRNYVRGRTNRDPHVTPAMALHVQEEPSSVPDLLAWRSLRSV